MPTNFFGIDLAWKSDQNPTTVIVLRGGRSGANLCARSDRLTSTEAIFSFVLEHSGSESVVAIDAPLIIANESGQRACETLVGKEYSAREASCHTSNLRLYPSASSVKLASALLRQGYNHALTVSRCRGRIVAEVYPHAALVALFDLPKTIKYKKGRVAEKRMGLASFRKLLLRLFDAEPCLLSSEGMAELLSVDLDALRGRALKAYEDTLDSLLCAYAGYYFWYWGFDRNEVFGDIESGYILNPKLIIGGVARTA